MQYNARQIIQSVLHHKRLQARPYFVYFLLLSLCIHVLVLVFFLRTPPLNPASSLKKGALTVSLVKPSSEDQAAALAKQQSTVLPKPKPKLPAPKPKPIKQKTIVQNVIKPPTKVMAKTQTEAPATFTVPTEMAAPKPIAASDTPPLDLSPPVEAPTNTADANKVDASKKDAPVDMMAMINQKRAARIAAGDAGAINDRAIAETAGLSHAEKAERRRKDNLKSGTSGIFEITTLRGQEATFAFKGWTGDYSNAQLQYYSVEAYSGGDIRLKIIRRMIALIREHYDGDFQWRSKRLRETITLSARPADNAGLEAFLMQEFAQQFDYYLH